MSSHPRSPFATPFATLFAKIFVWFWVTVALLLCVLYAGSWMLAREPRTADPHMGNPFRLMTAPNLYSLNASFYEQDELREKQQGMLLLINPADARLKGIAAGDRVIAWNDLGEVVFIARPDAVVPSGVVVAEGVWWLEFAPGNRSVNALTSQRLTDQGGGSTFYDNRVDLRREI